MMQIPEISNHLLRCHPWQALDSVEPKAIYLKTLPTYDEFFEKFLMKNQLCVIGPSVTASWESRRFWVGHDGVPDFEYLRTHFGAVTAPVADCSGEEFSAHPKLEMSVKEYLDYWEEYRSLGHPEDGKCLYLKDWHFTRDFPSYKAYSPPAFLSSDWLNEFWDVRKDEDKGDDYRFVYMGPKNSWTPFHADVLRSYSWSANICGRKKWIFYPPGEEELLMDVHGQLVFDVLDTKFSNIDVFPQASRARPITVIQNPGEIIFVPSGWHHQVFNLEDTISINHNWMNGASVHLSWAYLKFRLSAVQKEISDCRHMEGWESQCQMILKADSGIDFVDFYNFLALICYHRAACLVEYFSLKQDTSNLSLLGHENVAKVKKVLFKMINRMSIAQHSLPKCKSCQIVNQACHSDHDLCTSNMLVNTNNVEYSGKAHVACLDLDRIEDPHPSLGASQEAGEIICEMSQIFICLADPPGLMGLDKNGDFCDLVGTTHKHLYANCGNVLTADPNQKCVSSKVKDHTYCPHWAHCGPMLAIFDLSSALDLLKDMQKLDEFKDVNASGKMCCTPCDLITGMKTIVGVLKELVV